MKYTEEVWIHLMNDYKKGVRGSLDTGIMINEIEYIFERQYFYEKTISVMIPLSFSDLPLAAAKLKYPSEQRPQIIKADESKEINFAFSLQDIPVETKNITLFRDNLYHVIKTAQPANIFYDCREIDVHDTVLGFFDFKSFGLDDNLYNMMFCMPAAGKLLHGSFNCRLSQAENWKPVILQMLATFKVERKEQES